jgi:predicted transcriptional regulator
MECHSKLQKFVKAKNVTTSIIEKINSFFESIKTERVEWKTGPDFYWLEIHYIKKKKKQYHT